MTGIREIKEDELQEAPVEEEETVSTVKDTIKCITPNLAIFRHSQGKSLQHDAWTD